MTWRNYLFLFVLALAMNLWIASFQSSPGTIDADYYFVGGMRMVQGQGFTDPYLWNYIGDPVGLPSPSFGYWMPLASFITALGMYVSGQTTYAAGRLGFVLIAACVPPFTSVLAFSISGKRFFSILSGLLAILSFYYAPFLPTPDNYGIFMLLGALFFLLLNRYERWIPFALGIVSGLMALSRSDGLLWLGLAGLGLLWHPTDKPNLEFAVRIKKITVSGLFLFSGFLIIMGPWYARNLATFGAIMAPGGAGLLWMKDYPDIFAYPFSQNSFESFLSAGWTAAIQDRLGALQYNLLTITFMQNGIIMLPFVVVGLWQIRKELRTRFAITGWLILVCIMTIVFPFAGLRGSFYHAAAAFQPFWWAAAPLGGSAVFSRLRQRGDFDENYHFIAQGILLVLVLMVTAYLINLRLFQNAWGNEDQVYSSVNQILVENGIEQDDIAVVRNPPGYYLETGRSAIMVPTGDEATLLAVAARYRARFLVLEETHLYESYLKIYQNPDIDPRFAYLGEAEDGSKVFRIQP